MNLKRFRASLKTKEKAPSDVEDHKEPDEAIKITIHIKCEDTETIKEIYLSSSEIKHFK